MKKEHIRRFLVVSVACVGLIGLGQSALRAADEMVPINIKLPVANAGGTKQDFDFGPNCEPLQTNRAPFLAPKGVVNLAAGKKVTSSDPNVKSDSLAKIVDGDKKFETDSIVLLRKGVQWVEVDLGQPSELFAAVVWHAHDMPKAYHKVIVQVSENSDWTSPVTLFNNDWDGANGRGVGTNKEYIESSIGKLIDAKGAKGRYVRFYSKGSTDSAMNEYTEVEVYGRPAK